MKTKIVVVFLIMTMVAAICVGVAAKEDKMMRYQNLLDDRRSEKVVSESSQIMRNDVINVQYAHIGEFDPFDYDTSQPIDQGDAAWQQIAIPVNLNVGWKADVISDHDWSNTAWTIADALDEAAANQVPYYIYSAELYPKKYAIYVSEQFANMWP